MEMLENIIRGPIFLQMSLSGFQIAVILLELEMVNHNLKHFSI